jgi:hypothetical protein
MKRYLQRIIGKPVNTKGKAKHPDLGTRVIEHSKLLSVFEHKMTKFRAYVLMKYPNAIGINSNKIPNDKRKEIRRNALIYAGLLN